MKLITILSTIYSNNINKLSKKEKLNVLKNETITQLYAMFKLLFALKN